MTDNADRREILMTGYGDVRLLEGEEGCLEISQADAMGGEPSIVFITREQLPTLAAFIRKMQPEGSRS